jgi:hypothetical protein
VIRPEVNNTAKEPLFTPTAASNAPAVGRTHAENCARIKDLGYVASTHINLYGERFELVSDPVQEGDCVVVQVISGNDPTIRTLQLPVSILIGLSDRGGQKTKFGKRLR